MNFTRINTYSYFLKIENRRKTFVTQPQLTPATNRWAQGQHHSAPVRSASTQPLTTIPSPMVRPLAMRLAPT